MSHTSTFYEISRYAELINERFQPGIDPSWDLSSWSPLMRESVRDLLTAAVLAGFNGHAVKILLSAPGDTHAVTISDDDGMQCSAAGDSVIEAVQALTAVLRNGRVVTVPTVRIGFKRTAAEPYVAVLTAAGRQFAATGRDLDEVLSRLLLAVRVAAGSHRVREVE
jgi:hypothetical protein